MGSHPEDKPLRLASDGNQTATTTPSFLKSRRESRLFPQTAIFREQDRFGLTPSLPRLAKCCAGHPSGPLLCCFALP